MFNWLIKSKDNNLKCDSLSIRHVDSLPNNELKILNNLLPWASYVLDAQGRKFGKPFSTEKRATPEKIPDPRIVELNNRYPLRNLKVLEVGCFEGNHTTALSMFSNHVTAIDSRIEHVVKTLVRTSMFGYYPKVFRLDLEQPFPDEPEIQFDLLHHVGVLYHLSNPIKHLHEVLPHCTILMLDTHIATEQDRLSTFIYDEKSYRYKKYKEAGRFAPFAGMQDHAKWLLEEDLISILKQHGFNDIEIAERREERNGPRILLYAHKASYPSVFERM